MDTWLVAGLGNPGPAYAGNRHNIGAMVAGELARRADSTLKRHKSRCLVAEVRLGTPLPGSVPPRVVLAVPLSYMNESGGPVNAAMGYFGVPLERLVVVHDELDIPFGAIRLKRGGGEGGHNGLRSLSKALGSRDYLRVRVGIGRPPARVDPADHVLRDFSPAERKELPLLVAEGAEATEDVVRRGLLEAQGYWHARG